MIETPEETFGVFQYSELLCAVFKTHSNRSTPENQRTRNTDTQKLLESGPSVITEQNANPDPNISHEYENHNHTLHYHKLKWDTNKDEDFGSFIGTA
ncbi:hypothetical protein J6590_106505 [Homalodisca vitripennis]|nr:hypothetical protein J6590_106505 [Homalodisca vitripennis]